MVNHVSKAGSVLQAILIRVVSLSVLLVAWEWAGRARISVGLPPLSRVLEAVLEVARSGRLWDAALITGQAMAVGFLVSAALGILFGILMGVWPAFGYFFSSYFEALIALPVTALIPMVILLAGVGFGTEVIIVSVFATPFIAMNTLAGVREVDRGLREMARSFLATPWQILRKVILPAAAPMIFAGLRIGLARSLLGVVTAELLLVPRGIGELVWEFRELFRFPQLFSVLLFIIVSSVLLLGLVQRIERGVLRWRVQ